MAIKGLNSMRRRRAAARIARYIWAAPCTAVGMCLIAPDFLFDAHARVVDGVVEVRVPGFDEPTGFLKALPFNAITFGHIVVAARESELNRLRAHEHEHGIRGSSLNTVRIAHFLAYRSASSFDRLRGNTLIRTVLGQVYIHSIPHQLPTEYYQP